MNVTVALVTLVLLAVVIWVISSPLRTMQPNRSSDLAGQAELEAARESKYREIRDTEMDYRTGKLSREDYEASDATLRAEALEILVRLGANAAPAAENGEDEKKTNPKVES